MNPIVRNILAVIAGLVAGGVVNMAIILASAAIVPPPPGADMTTPEGIKAAMPLLQPKHFVMPFLAHALGSFAGATTAAFLAASRKMRFALGLGGFTMLGGIAAAAMIPAPTWFIALDLIGAYLPPAWLGGRLAQRNQRG